MTTGKGRRIGLSPSFELYSSARVDAPCMAASDCSSHRALQNDAAASNNAESSGKAETATILLVSLCTPARKRV